jgi:hypothetical protein
MTAIFAPALEKYTRNLLARIALDYNLNEDELIAKYITNGIPITKKTPGPKKPRVPKEDRTPCPGFTGKKKTPCKNFCLPGDTACHFHSDKPKVPKVIQAPAPSLAEDNLCEPCNDTLTPLDFQMLKQAADEAIEELSKPGATVEVEPEESESESEEDPVAEMSIQERLRMIIGEEELDE